jgi:hypothetical protein
VIRWLLLIWSHSLDCFSQKQCDVFSLFFIYLFSAFINSKIQKDFPFYLSIDCLLFRITSHDKPWSFWSLKLSLNMFVPGLCVGMVCVCGWQEIDKWLRSEEKRSQDHIVVLLIVFSEDCLKRKTWLLREDFGCIS